MHALRCRKWDTAAAGRHNFSALAQFNIFSYLSSTSYMISGLVYYYYYFSFFFSFAYPTNTAHMYHCVVLSGEHTIIRRTVDICIEIVYWLVPKPQNFQRALINVPGRNNFILLWTRICYIYSFFFAYLYLLLFSSAARGRFIAL